MSHIKLEPFKMKFVEPVFDTPEYKIIKQALEASGHGPVCYNKTDQYLILDGLYYRTGTYDDFINVNYPELTYEQFVAKYKIKHNKEKSACYVKFL